MCWNLSSNPDILPLEALGLALFKELLFIKEAGLSPRVYAPVPESLGFFTALPTGHWAPSLPSLIAPVPVLSCSLGPFSHSSCS